MYLIFDSDPHFVSFATARDPASLRVYWSWPHPMLKSLWFTTYPGRLVGFLGMEGICQVFNPAKLIARF